MQNILFLTSVHHSKDDRIFYHQAKALVKEKYSVCIFSFLEHRVEMEDNISIESQKIDNLPIKEQIKHCLAISKEKKPTLIICDTPKTVLFAIMHKIKNKCKIIYDITEWYPSKKNFTNTSSNLLIKIIKATFLSIVNLVAGLCSDMLIFGEYYKSLPFLLFFWKKHTTIHYYPDLKYIKRREPLFIQDEIGLFYSGKFNVDKGIDKVIQVARLLALKAENTNIKLNLVGFFACEEDEKLVKKLSEDLPKNMTVNMNPYLNFELFCETIVNNDVFLDLRVKDIENTHCLPIKIFYYMACGRPVIYTDLKSIKKEVLKESIGLFCNPNQIEEIANHIHAYINQQALYESHCQNSLDKSHKLYNWEIEREKYINSIKSLIS